MQRKRGKCAPNAARQSSAPWTTTGKCRRRSRATRTRRARAAPACATRALSATASRAPVRPTLRARQPCVLCRLPCIPARFKKHNPECFGSNICGANIMCLGGTTCGTTCNPGYTYDGTACVRTFGHAQVGAYAHDAPRSHVVSAVFSPARKHIQRGPCAWSPSSSPHRPRLAAAALRCTRHRPL